MKTYLVKCEVEREFNAESEEEAIEMFFDDMALSNESIENFVIAEEV